MSLSSIESLLTRNIRSFLFRYISTENLKLCSFIIALVSCVCSGSVLLFSIFTPALQKQLQYSQLQINSIASLSSIGMYLFLPLLGYLADCHGPVLLAVLSMVLFCPGYLIAAYVVQNTLGHWIMAWSFMFIGCATSSLYFSSLLTCAKIFPQYKGLSISAPVTFYGLSSLIGAQLLTMDYFKKDSMDVDGEIDLDLYKIFIFFGGLYFVTGLLNWVASSVVSIESDVVFESSKVFRPSDEESPLLEGGSSATTMSTADNENVEDQLDGRPIEPRKHKERYLEFLADKSAWLLLISLFLSIGPLEMFNNNMGSLISIIKPVSPSVSAQVSIYAASSTLTRLFLGALSDFLSQKFKICRVWLLTIVIIFGSVGQFLISINVISINSGQFFPFVSLLNGSSYGGLFTLYPTIVATIWGIDIMGSTWGSFMVAPAIGSIAYSLFYGEIFDSVCSVPSASLLPSSFQYTNCLSQFFALTTVSFLVSLLIVFLIWKMMWSKRGFSNF